MRSATSLPMASPTHFRLDKPGPSALRSQSEETAMAKNGFKVFDSDMHIMEPVDLWERYIAPEFRPEAPRGRTSDNVRDLGLIFPKPEANVNRTAGTPHRGRNFEKNQGIYRDHSERGW